MPTEWPISDDSGRVPDQPENETTMPKTVRARFPAFVAPDGSWNVYGWGGGKSAPSDKDIVSVAIEGTSDAFSDHELRLVWVTVDLPLPEACEVKGEVADA